MNSVEIPGNILNIFKISVHDKWASWLSLPEAYINQKSTDINMLWKLLAAPLSQDVYVQLLYNNKGFCEVKTASLLCAECF